MKKILLTVALVGLTFSANAKEINLKCTYTSMDNEPVVDMVYLDTDNKRAGLDGSSISLYNDNTAYWFTSYATEYMTRKHQIDRNDLSYTSQLKVLDLVTTFKVKCNVVESKAKI